MALRNSIGNTLATVVERQDWYDEPGFLRKREAMDIFSAKFDLSKEGKNVTVGRVIARQTFGFWTSLISGGYSIWSDNNHAAIKLAFPMAPTRWQYRSRAFEHLNTVRLFRNRVFHYEPIIDGLTLQNGSHISLSQIHANVIDAIGWMNTVFQSTIMAFDRFPTVYNNGAEAIEARIKWHLGIA